MPNMNEYLVVDNDLRTITIPESIKHLGVEYDNDVLALQFKIPRNYYGIDLSDFDVQINYVNAEDNGDVYHVPYTNVSASEITFDWLVGRFAFAKTGNVKFNVCLKKIIDDKIVKEFNTMSSSLPVLKGLETTEIIVQEIPDILEQWHREVLGMFNGEVDKSLSKSGMAADAAETGEQLRNVKHDIHNKAASSEVAAERARIDQIVSENTNPASDTELVDIRADFYGLTHASAGTAVRQTGAMLDRVKQRLYGIFESLVGTEYSGSVYNVNTKVTQTLENGYYSEYDVTNLTMVQLSGYSWSSYDSYPLGAFFDSNGNLLCKMGHTWSGAHVDVLYYVPKNATSLIVNGSIWKKPIVQKFVAGDLEGDIINIKKDVASNIRPSKLTSYNEVGTLGETIQLSVNNTELIEAQIYSSSGELDSGVVGNVTYDTLIFPVGVYESFLLNKYPIGVYGGAFLDIDKNWLSSFGTDYPNNLEIKVAPENAYYIAISVNSTNRYWSITGYCKKYSLSGLIIPSADNFWANKKIVWIGTSVTFGQNASTSYPYEASELLGFNLVNCSVPGLAIHTNSDGTPLTYGSLAMTKNEYAANGTTIPDAPIAYTPGGSYNDYYRTYENVFCEANSDADLYVFDISPNNTNFNTTDWDAFDFVNWKYSDDSAFSEHRATFLGALLFLMDKMYAYNENARMIFVLSSGFAYSEGKTAFQKLTAKWNIPVIDLWGKMNTSPKSITKLYSQDGTDPHPSTYAHKLMGQMMAHELNGVC